MKQKPRKFTNGFYPTNETDLEEMADKERDNFDNRDTVLRLSQIKTDLSSSEKLTAEEESDVVGVIRDEIESEQFLLRTLYTSVDTVKIYSVSKWSRHKVTQELEQYKELLAEMETHEEIIKMLNNICELVNKDNNKEDVDDEFNLSDEVKPVQTVLYQLWLRLLEWECLLEQHAGPRTRQETEEVTDCNDEEILKTPAENVSQGGESVPPERNVESFTMSSPSSSLSPDSISMSSPSLSTGSLTMSSPSHLSRDSQSGSINKTEHSDSDSGVSDLSSDLTFYKSRRPTGLKWRSEAGRKQRPPVSPRQSPPTAANTTSKSDKPDPLLDWIKWSMLIFLIFLIIFTLLVFYHVKCYNNVCAISLDTKIHYYKYSSPI